jgi:hypothetical protein
MGSHFYTPDGRLVGGLREARVVNALPSVTTVLSMLKGEGLIRYFKKSMHEATATTPRRPEWTDKEFYEACERWADQHSQTARDKGLALHKVIQEFHQSLVDKVPWSPEVLLTPELADGYDLYLRWYEKWVKKTLIVEEVLFGEGYAGRVDHVALLKDGRVAVCDVKTQDTTKTKRFSQYPEHFLQLGAYAGTIKPTPDVLISIYVSSNAPTTLEAYVWPGSPQLGHELFLNLLRLWQFVNNYQFQETTTDRPVEGAKRMRTAEEWHHTGKYIDAHGGSLNAKPSGTFKCSCVSCQNVRAIQADALRHASELAKKHRPPATRIKAHESVIEEVRASIRDEERGERIAAEEIFKQLQTEADKLA